jgi:hypothetical protein
VILGLSQFPAGNLQKDSSVVLNLPPGDYTSKAFYGGSLDASQHHKVTKISRQYDSKTDKYYSAIIEYFDYNRYGRNLRPYRYRYR